MSAPHRDRLTCGDSQTVPVDLPLALATLVSNRDLIDQVQRMTWTLTAGDFEALVIWCELSRHGSAEVGHVPRPLPLHDLVSATAIPRETVRRKLKRLAALGYVGRVGHGWVVRTGPADPALQKRAEGAVQQTRDALNAPPVLSPMAVPEAQGGHDTLASA